MINFPNTPTPSLQYTYVGRAWEWCPAPIWLRPFMRLCGFHGWASFWRMAYIMPGCEDNARLIRHELCHLRQIERDGRAKFAVRYMWWLLRYGYHDNPYEIEAREAEHHVQ